MAADVGIDRLTGSGPTTTRIDSGGGSGSTRASTSDSPTPGTNDPIPIPGAGTNYSYWVVTRLDAYTTPSGTINNILWYTDGTNAWTGVTVEVGTSSAYSQATGSQGNTGDELTDTNYTGGTLAPTDPSADSAFGYDDSSLPGSALSVTGSLTNPSTGGFGDYVIYQLSVGTGAAAGTLAAETFSFQYDET